MLYNPVYCLYETLIAIRKKNKSITNVYMYMRVIKLNSIYETASFVNIFKNNNNDRNSNNKTVNKNNADCCLTCFRLSSQAKLKNYLLSTISHTVYTSSSVQHHKVYTFLSRSLSNVKVYTTPRRSPTMPKAYTSPGRTRGQTAHLPYGLKHLASV